MEQKPSDLTLKIARQAIDVAMKCVATGETLLPFVLTEGSPGVCSSLVGDGFDSILAMAQNSVNSLEPGTTAFAFAYDGFITVREERNDCIYIEAGEVKDGRIFVFAQRYRPKRFLRSVKPIGNWLCLEETQPKLKWNAEPRPC